MSSIKLAEGDMVCLLCFFSDREGWYIDVTVNDETYILSREVTREFAVAAAKFGIILTEDFLEKKQICRKVDSNWTEIYE